MSNYSLFIGSDISKSVIDVSFHYEGLACYLGQFANNENGYSAFVKALSKMVSIPKNEWFVCFENTGVYSKPILNWLIAKNIACREENALNISKSLGIRRGKDDKVDSLDICQFAYEKRDSIRPTILPEQHITRLKKLLSRRDFLVRQRQSLKVSLKEQDGFISAEILEDLQQGNDNLISTYDAEINNLDTKIERLIQSNEDLSKNDKLARSVKGIGPVTSAYIIATTHNFTIFDNPKKYACYCGVAPFPNSSGTRTGRKKVSHIANKKMKSLLSNCAMTAKNHDPELSKYYKRKIEDGKQKGIVINALKNKLINRVFAVIKRGTPYVQLMNYA